MRRIKLLILDQPLGLVEVGPADHEAMAAAQEHLEIYDLSRLGSLEED